MRTEVLGAEPASSEPAAADSGLCPNCRQPVPAERMTLHKLHCERHLVFCDRCNRGVRPSNHHHCDQCEFVTDNAAALAKHTDLFHQ